MLVVRRVDVDEIDVELAARGRWHRAGTRCRRAPRPARGAAARARCRTGAPRPSGRPSAGRSCCRRGRPPRAARSARRRARPPTARSRRSRRGSRRSALRSRAGSNRARRQNASVKYPSRPSSAESSARIAAMPLAIERLVGDDVGLAEHLRVGGEIVGVDGDSEAAQRLPDARRAGEEVARRRDRKTPGYALDQWHERALRPQVLDHSCSSNAALRQWPQTRPLD